MSTFSYSSCYSKRAYRSLFILLSLVLCDVASGQVKTYSSIKLQGRGLYNYAPESMVYRLPKKSKSPQVVYIDRSGVKAYQYAFGGQVQSEPKLGTACYILREHKGYAELIEANAKLVGKPKGLWSFLYSSKNHLKDIKGANYLGWVSKKSLLGYNHSYVKPKNLAPVRYAVGISRLEQLYALKPHLQGDSLRVYSDPFLREGQENTWLKMGALVYAYKRDASGESVLVSDYPSLQDSRRRLLGWIPSGMLAEVGQGEVFRLARGASTRLQGIQDLYTDTPDTLEVSERNLNTRVLFLLDRTDRDRTVVDSLQGSLTLTEALSELALPLSVWDKASNRFLNIKGGEISMQDVEHVREGSRNLSCHVVFFESDWTALRPVLSAFQRLALRRPEYKQSLFSASIIGAQSMRYLAPTTDIASWLDFLLSGTGAKVQMIAGGFSSAMDELLKAVQPDNFGGNLCFVFGSKQTLSLSSQQIQGLARRSIIPVFMQISGEASDDGQDFLLNAKELLNGYIMTYDKYISSYLVDAGLKRPYLFGEYGSEEKVYLLDAPENSLVMGGVAYPGAGSSLSGRAVENSLDTLLWQFDARSKLLLESLGKYESELGILRSQPNPVLQKLHARDSLIQKPLSKIVRNAASDTYYTSVWVPDSVVERLQGGYLLSEDRVQELLQGYERLLPEFTTGLGDDELSYLRRTYKEEAHRLKAAWRQQLLPKHYTLSDLFELSLGVRSSDVLLLKLEPKKLSSYMLRHSDLNEVYAQLVSKRKQLESDYRDGKLETVALGGASYYFIPQTLLP